MTEELKSKILEAIKPMEGWCWDEKAIALAEVILAHKPTCVVEIGVFGGKSVIPQALALQQNGIGTIYGVDPWKKDAAMECSTDPENVKWWHGVDLDLILKGCSETIWKHCLDNHAVLLRCDSVSASKLFPKNSVDVLHIDGNHSETVSMRDVLHWLPKVRQGGHIWLDDFHWDTVTKARQTLDSACEIVRDIVDPSKGSCRLYLKR